MDDVVRLRDVKEEDLEVFFEQQRDEEAVRRARFPSRDRETFMRHWATRVLGNPTGFVQAVTVNGAVAGSIMAWWEGELRYVGYWFGREWWGRGIGTEALRAFLQREPIRPLHADPFTGNTASVRLLERCGFRRSGTFWHGENEHVLLTLAQ
jgi:RimJ/RimL family protein N-acetyltransferase